MTDSITVQGPAVAQAVTVAGGVQGAPGIQGVPGVQGVPGPAQTTAAINAAIVAAQQRHITMIVGGSVPDLTDAATAGTWASVFSAAYGIGAASYSGLATLGSWAAWEMYLPAGTWDIVYQYVTANAGGQGVVEYSLDGGATWVTLSGTVDHYTLNVGANGITASLNGGIVVPSGGQIVYVRVRATGKDVASASYQLYIEAFTAHRTA
jgi:hypothetical protein